MVVLQPEDRVPPWLVDERHGLEVMRQLDDGWCAALDRGTFRCGIYEQRPQACRDFATGSRECRTERRENGIPDESPTGWAPTEPAS